MTPRLARQPGERTRLRWGFEARLLLGHCSPRLSALSGPSRIGPTDHFEGIRASHIKGQTLVEMAGTHHRSHINAAVPGQRPNAIQQLQSTENNVNNPYTSLMIRLRALRLQRNRRIGVDSSHASAEAVSERCPARATSNDIFIFRRQHIRHANVDSRAIYIGLQLAFLAVTVQTWWSKLAEAGCQTLARVAVVMSYVGSGYRN